MTIGEMRFNTAVFGLFARKHASAVMPYPIGMTAMEPREYVHKLARPAPAPANVNTIPRQARTPYIR